ncbi:hypothetical protein J3B02_002518 [Coemansia erecta]|uniref:Uncharacterized protein n=1 Tax=Coemansia asiatica TaxID=1052880 RepID=A0A9W8CI38_9FUNG|nr:hypothetical protein LPJ64_004161 [Coemansia asiatica]KAJ2854756.1 hypothetical protein J3B02_002518 [Coemansia erecta]KAJ2880962.1 hypothetical protein FB639_002716 [Coemansia asiatica]
MSTLQGCEYPSVIIKRLHSKNDRAAESYSQPIVFKMPDSLELRALNDLVEATWYIAPGYQVFVTMHPNGSISRLDIKDEFRTRTIWSRQIIYAYNSKYFEEVGGNLLNVPQQQDEYEDSRSQMQMQAINPNQIQKQMKALVQNSTEDDKYNDNDETDAKTICPSSLPTTNSETAFSIPSFGPGFSYKS